LFEQVFKFLSRDLHTVAFSAHLPELHLNGYLAYGHPVKTGQLIYLDLHDPSEHLFGYSTEHPTSKYVKFPLTSLKYSPSPFLYFSGTHSLGYSTH